MQRVFVLDKQKQPLMPCHPARARMLLRQGNAAVFRRFPFTIILKDRSKGDVQPADIRLDPGSKETGVAVVVRGKNADRCVWGANIAHRGYQIKEALDLRRALRRGRRNRQTRYRQPRFLNRTRAKDWLPPSIQSRVHNVETWTKRLVRLTPANAAQVETVRFDTQLLENANISGADYQRGTLFGYELREYLLERHQHTCAYCGGLTKDPILEIEHLQPRSKGGSDRVGNLVIACRTCNEDKNNHLPASWQTQCAEKRDKLSQTRAKNMARILDGYRPSLRDAAAVNASRYAIGAVVKDIFNDVTFWSGGRTKKNRTAQQYRKDHWLDAACIGERGDNVIIEPSRILRIEAKGHGSRQMCRMDRYGFPRTSAKGARSVKGFKTGDMIKAVVLTGKKAGAHTGRVAVRSSGSFNIKTANQVLQGIGYKYCQTLHRNDGYNYNIGGGVYSPT